ncbi:phage holin family protein [Paraburkholderia hospita]|nr:phage holin family protein [Paraburkholderia hospita]
MHQIMASLSIIAYMVAAFYIVTFRRGEATHKHHVAWSAWLLLVVLGGSALDMVLHPRQVGAFETLLALFIAGIVYRARGNVARILWGSE